MPVKVVDLVEMGNRARCEESTANILYATRQDTFAPHPPPPRGTQILV